MRTRKRLGNRRAYQRELRQFYSLARAEGGKISAVTFTTDRADGGDGFVGEFLVPFTSVAGSTLTAATGAWLQGRAGRRLRLKMADTEVEATGPGELYGLLNLTMAVTERHEKPRPTMSETALAVRSSAPLPALVINAGEPASVRFLEFFTSTIRNPNTRRAYAHPIRDRRKQRTENLAMSRPHTHAPLHLLRPVVTTSPYRVPLTFMLDADARCRDLSRAG
ncbi:MAG: hypothetical protein QOJ04_1777 [Caballeronia sp.]|jgi:hypothetical protein|nr:hypothetical protein [Caballeronia sp.]